MEKGGHEGHKLKHYENWKGIIYCQYVLVWRWHHLHNNYYDIPIVMFFAKSLLLEGNGQTIV